MECRRCGAVLRKEGDFCPKCYKEVLEEEELTDDVLLSAINHLYENRESYVDTMKRSSQQNSIDTIIDLIESVTA